MSSMLASDPSSIDSDHHSGAPPAYTRFDTPSTSWAASERQSPTLSTKGPSKSSLGRPSSSSSTPYYQSGTGSNNYYQESKTDPRHSERSSRAHYARGRAAPDFSVSGPGKPLSEKAPQHHATQTQHPSSSYGRQHNIRGSSRGRSGSAASLARPHYPPTSSHGDEASGCACFSGLPPKVRLWLSFGAWIATSLGFIIAIAFYKTEVFTALDNLSLWLVNEGYNGYAYMFGLIVLTTVPPFPLYSTLMMLAGYTWGTWPGFVLSYTSSLFGAIFVYFISRYFFGSNLASLLKHMPTFARTVRAVSRNPKLLFLVRFAPYPYNVMNVLLAACPSLKWRTYIGCTAFSLLKVVVHTSIGSGIRSFKGYHGVGEGQGIDGEKTPEEQRSSDLAKWSTVVGVILCILLFLYLGHMARQAVDSELEDDDFYETSEVGSTLLPVHRPRHDFIPRSPFSASRHQREPSTAEERMAFLSPLASDSDEDDHAPMAESRPTGGSHFVGSRGFIRR
ncbi:hypothetical protein CPB86DRAFT_815069 [Serendipita vermifera]|nr:hypothetical protein CPB86DRAFT_815069 [Serendipita vermifera]